MPRKKFTEAQIALVVRELDNGAPVAELCRKLDVSDVTLYNWKRKYARMGNTGDPAPTPTRRRECQTQTVGRGSDSGQSDVAGCPHKKVVKPARRQGLVRQLQERYCVSERRACRLVQLRRSVYRYKSRRDPQTALRSRLKELAACRPRYGYRRLYILLRREGWKINHKRTYRLYLEEGLPGRTLKRKKYTMRPRIPLLKATQPDERWSMDFMTDTLVNGRRFRILTVVDLYSRECVLLATDFSLTAPKVGAALEQLGQGGRLPQAITVDNDSEFVSKNVETWTSLRKVKLDFIRPGKPVETAYIES